MALGGAAVKHQIRGEGDRVSRRDPRLTRWLPRAVLAGVTAALIAGPGIAVASPHATAARSSPPSTLTLSISGEGIVNAAGHAPCNQSCVVSLPRSKALTLRATPAQGYSFPGWQQGCSGDASICVIPPGANAQVTVSFVRSSTLELTVSGPGTVTSSPGGIDCGQSQDACTSTVQGTSAITLNPVPASGAAFLGWGGPCTQYGTASCQLNGGSDAGVTATFGSRFLYLSPPPSSLTVSHPDLTVSSAPNLLGPCTQNPCSASTQWGAQVSLTGGGGFALDPLQPLPQIVWSGACRGVWPVCSLVVEGPTNVHVDQLFPLAFTGTGTLTSSYELPIATYGRGTVVAGPHSACRHPTSGCSRGQTVQLIARPARGYRFGTWYAVGFNCSHNPVCTGRAGPSEQVAADFPRRR